MLLKLLTSLLPTITPRNTKVHLAQHNGIQHPMEVYLAGDFDEWQSWQSQRNFECEYVIGLVELPGTKKWLLAGVYDSLKVREVKGEKENRDYVYDSRRVPEFAELEGRLVLDYKKPRANYLFLETCLKGMTLSSVLEKPLTVGKFPGFKDVDVTHKELKLIVNQGLESWQTALSSVAGVYLISDNTKGEQQLYVGSATGTGGLWDRWVTYSKNGHGGNTRITDLHKKRGYGFADNFRFSILEIADKHTGVDEMKLKEIHWKQRLLTRDSGLNGN
ncbi:GIY-YIG nuclease family protein [Pseudomonas viridiflava]|uniref:GIY-YIG nuclease family protein n=1 Tax=Pseudomonas viridiflava TaxID=33069 RepID=UPI001C31714E|nr:GIY-YIG nuclease family protein [Pseudomonas viridiflava]QXG39150.1 GIY-YIG nuclease family protein [Pseudomonas viridiflava]